MKIVVVDFGAPGVKKIIAFLKSKNVNYRTHNPCKNKKLPKCDGIILSGGPQSVCQKNHLSLNTQNNILTSSAVPILGICYGAQLICIYNGGKLRNCKLRQCFDDIKIDKRYKLYKGLKSNEINVMFRHNDYILEVPENFVVTSMGKQNGLPIIFSFQDKEKQIYAVQYHPEIKDDKSKKHDGKIILENFLDICLKNM